MDVVALLERPWRDPVLAAAPFAAEPSALVLLTGHDAPGWSYLAIRPDAVLIASAGDPDPFVALAALIGPATTSAPGGPPFQGGVAGLCAYELGARAEGVGLPRADGWPDLACARYDALLAFDGAARRVVAVGRGPTRPAAQAQARRAAGWLDVAAAAPARDGRLSAAFASGDGPAYEAAVAEVIGRIAAGEIFQANVARRWRGRLAPGAAPFDVFARLATDSPAPFAAYLMLDGRAVVSNSPERFVSIAADGRTVRTQPIKGTRPRGAAAAADAALAAELLASAKDRAENLMIVDLMRNDLSRVCDAVAAPDLFRLSTFANVHHLVSTVTGRLREGLGPADLLRATLPPGSITGAPKVQAMRVIGTLEPPRGPFFGAMVWAGADGAMESSVLIRTAAFVRDGEGWRLEARAGAGIVAESDPRQERLETEAKIDALRRALSEARR